MAAPALPLTASAASLLPGSQACCLPPMLAMKSSRTCSFQLWVLLTSTLFPKCPGLCGNPVGSWHWCQCWCLWSHIPGAVPEPPWGHLRAPGGSSGQGQRAGTLCARHEGGCQGRRAGRDRARRAVRGDPSSSRSPPAQGVLSPCVGLGSVWAGHCQCTSGS